MAVPVLRGRAREPPPGWAMRPGPALPRTGYRFRRARGQAYRALVIGTRAHTAATTHILRSARRPSLTPA
jgi:hypothetical protein